MTVSQLVMQLNACPPDAIILIPDPVFDVAEVGDQITLVRAVHEDADDPTVRILESSELTQPGEFVGIYIG